MSQQQILDLLQKKKEPLSRSQIAEQLNQDPIKVSHLLCKLIDTNEISFKEFDRHKASEMNNVTVYRRTRFYFVIR